MSFWSKTLWVIDFWNFQNTKISKVLNFWKEQGRWGTLFLVIDICYRILDSVEMNWSVDTKWVILAQPVITCSKLTIETLEQRGEIC